MKRILISLFVTLLVIAVVYAGIRDRNVEPDCGLNPSKIDFTKSPIVGATLTSPVINGATLVLPTHLTVTDITTTGTATVTGKATVGALKINATDITSAPTQINFLNTTTSDVQVQISGKVTGSSVTQIVYYNKSVDFTVVETGPNTYSDQTFACAGVTTADVIFMNPTSAPTSGVFIVYAWVSSADTISCRLINTTAAPVDPAAVTYMIMAVRHN